PRPGDGKGASTAARKCWRGSRRPRPCGRCPAPCISPLRMAFGRTMIKHGCSPSWSGPRRPPSNRLRAPDHHRQSPVPEVRAMVRRLGAWLFVMLAAGIAVAAQQTARDAAPPRPGTASIDGTLVAIDSGRPVRRARVSLTSAAGTSVGQSVTTDDLGVFTFKDLPAGAYTLTASKPGYLDSIYGQRRPGTGRPGTPIQLADGQ